MAQSSKSTSNPFRRKLTDQQISDCFLEHLPYEIDMLRGTLSLLRVGDINPIAHYSRIESFAIHARNLLEFFMRRGECDFDPRIFAIEGYELYSQTQILDADLIKKINEQISHLSKDRTRNPNEKLGPTDWETISASLEAEIERFAINLSKLFKMQWKYNRTSMLDVTSTVGATNAIFILRGGSED
jgi:hypothetical protein